MCIVKKNQDCWSDEKHGCKSVESDLKIIWHKGSLDDPLARFAYMYRVKTLKTNEVL